MYHRDVVQEAAAGLENGKVGDVSTDMVSMPEKEHVGHITFQVVIDPSSRRAGARPATLGPAP